MRYQSAPRNIYRHVVLSEMKEATAALPLVRGPPGAHCKPQTPARSILVPSVFSQLLRVAHKGLYMGRTGCSECPVLSSWSQVCLGVAISGTASPLLSSPSLQEVTSQPVMGFDPLPPLDSIISYTRPERYLLSAPPALCPPPFQTGPASTFPAHPQPQAWLPVGTWSCHPPPCRSKIHPACSATKRQDWFCHVPWWSPLEAVAVDSL